MKCNKYTYLIAFVLIQMFFAPMFADTVSINNVEIYAIREQFYQLPRQNTYLLDSFSKSIYGNNNLSELLQNSTNIYVNNYGLGASNTISMRGTADDQTAIFWNGINIRSSTLGSTDVSLIPIQATNKISVVTNGASSIYGSGTFGGSILIANEPNWNNKISTSTRYSFGSFQQHHITQEIEVGNHKIQFQTNNAFQKAENNFTFKDVYLLSKPIRTIEHNAFQNWITQNYLYIKLAKQQQIHFGSWIQKKDKEIPASMGGSLQSDKYQKDFTAKNYVLYKKVFKKSSLYNRLSAIYDKQNYKDETQQINTSYKLSNITNSLNYRYYFEKDITIDAGLDYNFFRAKVSEYSKIQQEHRTSFFFGFKYFYKQLSLNATVRQEIYGKQYIRPLFGVNITYTSKNDVLQLNLNYADKFRLPDFNDKYWPVGGNPDLLPEKGYTIEMNISLNKISKNSKYQIIWNNASYYTRIKDNIAWIPFTGIFWQPKNIKNTQHVGFESSVQQNIRIAQKLKLNSTIQYAFNKSTILKDVTEYTIGKIMRYKPMHQLKANLSLEERYFSIGLNYSYNGKRFTDDENSKSFQLPAYHIIDCIIAYKLDFKKLQTQFIFQINNLINTAYESIISYAQPMRNYKITFQINYSK